MKIEEEIAKKLETQSPNELIKEGYKKSTVYKVSKSLGLSRYDLGTKFVVTKLEKIRNAVVIHLIELVETSSPEEFFPPSPPEPVPFDVIEPKNDEERMVKHTMNAIQKYFPQFSEIYGASGRACVAPAKTRMLAEIALNISIEQYRKIGSPAIDSVLQLNLRKVKR